MAMLTAITLLSFREQIAGLYSKELDVIQLTQQFLVFALFFQFSDAIATPIQGILRGYKDVTVPFITALVSYWLVALPVGYLLAHFSFLGAFGYWVGLIAGITFNAAALLRRLYVVQNKRIAGDY
jgi:MATE family multidrug resistance protein